MTRVAIVTGGQRGIGFGVARALVKDGFHVALVAERPSEHREVAEALDVLGPNAFYFEHDLRDINGFGNLLDGIETRIGPVTSLVSNAGISAPKRDDMLELAAENFDLVMDINLKAGFFLAQQVARRMLSGVSADYRSLVFVTSVSAELVSIERAEYCLSKAGAAMMTKLFAARLAEAGIGVFELRPGIIETDMTAAVRDKYDARIADGLIPAKRWGHPSDIADAVLPLVNGSMSYATGAVIPVDGGLGIHRL